MNAKRVPDYLATPFAWIEYVEKSYIKINEVIHPDLLCLSAAFFLVLQSGCAVSVVYDCVDMAIAIYFAVCCNKDNNVMIPIITQEWR